MFRAPCAHRQEVKIVLYSLGYHHTYRWLSRAQVERGLVEMHAFQPVLSPPEHMGAYDSQIGNSHLPQKHYTRTAF